MGSPHWRRQAGEKGCMYEPHVLGVMTNQDIESSMADPTNHNIHPQPKDTESGMNAQPPGGENKKKSFARQEIIDPLKATCIRGCAPISARQPSVLRGDRGRWNLHHQRPAPGTYTLEAWHEKYPPQNVQITVGPRNPRRLISTSRANA